MSSILLAACSAAPDAAGDDGAGGSGPQATAPDGPGPAEATAFPDQDVRAPQAAGTLLVLGPTRIVATPETAGAPPGPDPDLLDAWFRELLRASSHLDVADDRAGDARPLGAGDTARLGLGLAVDPVAGVWTTTLEPDAAPPVPLAMVECPAGAPLGAIADACTELAARTRTALGDPAVRGPLPTPRSVYSGEPACVRATERGLRQRRRGQTAQARVDLQDALTRDPGSTFTLAELLAVELSLGVPAADVARRAQLALRNLAPRTSPTTRHRLARVYWLASVERGAPLGEDAALEKLLELGRVAVDERPHDPHGWYTVALASNQLGAFEDSAPVLRRLHARWPREGLVGYQLCFAELAVGRPDRALEAIRSAAGGLPPELLVVPTAIALYQAGEFGELERWLAELGSRASRSATDRTGHDVLRMQASLAILRGQRDAAAAYLLRDLEWMRQRPSWLERLAGDLAETGEVLVLLGRARDLAPHLAALQEINVQADAVGNALIYVAGLALVATDGNRPGTALDELARRSETAWRASLEAAVHRRKGDVNAEAAALSASIRVADEPLRRAQLARVLRTLGRDEQADRLLEDMRRSVARLDLRQPLTHPLFQPGLALAVLAQRPDADGREDAEDARSGGSRRKDKGNGR